MRLLLTLARLSELPVALRVGPDLLDVKDPARGSLGAPDPRLLRAVAVRVAGRVPLSVPLGDGPHEPAALARRVREVLGSACGARAANRHPVVYLKIGLLGAGGENVARWLAIVREVVRGTDCRVRLAAVSFADAAPALAPAPEELPEIALRGGADAVMLDTLGKGAGSVLDALGRERLRRWARAARERGLETAVAGGLDPETIPRLAGLGLDVVGVRGGACVSGRRAGRLDAERCRAIARATREAGRVPPGAAPPPVAPDHTSSVEIAGSPRSRRATRSG